MKSLALITLFCAAALTGCAKAPTLAAPDDFAKLERGDNHAFRATNASGVVIGVRSESNELQGSLDFWSSALDNKLRKNGYKRTATDAVTTRAGLTGKRFRYEVERNGRTTEYWIGVFVTAKDVVVVEAGGDTAFFDEATEKRVDEAFKSLELG